MNPSRVKRQAASRSKKYTIRDALSTEIVLPGSALGSPSKSTMDSVRRRYFDANEATNSGDSVEQQQGDDEMLDVAKLREKLRR